MAARVCVARVEDFCPEVQTGRRGLRPCLTLTVSLGPCSTRPAVHRNHFIPAVLCCLPAPGCVCDEEGRWQWPWGLIYPQICLASARIPEESVGCYSENCWEISALGMALPPTTICAAAAAAGAAVTSSTSKQILHYFCHTLVSSEDRSLNKLL